MTFETLVLDILRLAKENGIYRQQIFDKYVGLPTKMGMTKFINKI